MRRRLKSVALVAYFHSDSATLENKKHMHECGHRLAVEMVHLPIACVSRLAVILAQKLNDIAKVVVGALRHDPMERERERRRPKFNEIHELESPRRINERAREKFNPCHFSYFDCLSLAAKTAHSSSLFAFAFNRFSE
jgi:hypothetical protein